ETAPEGAATADAAAARRLPAPLTAALALTGVLGIALSGAPQLVLRFTETGLF
ncbi:NADH-quinone oxidoreductase subunit N, partial [Streptomyces albidoflavus]